MTDVQFESLYKEAVRTAEYQRRSFNWLRFMGWVILLPILGGILALIITGYLATLIY